MRRAKPFHDFSDAGAACARWPDRRGERRRVVRPALPTLLLFAIALVPSLGRAQLPSDGKSSYSRDDRIRIPFELRAGGPATSVKLFSSFDGGGWHEYETARAGMKKEFIFKADRDGPYSFATMTLFSDGTSDPSGKDRLVEQRRVVVDRTPPKIVSVRAIVTSDGAAGLEWDATDDNMDPRGVHLEFRWAGDLNYQPIDKGVPFAPRDHRHWQMRANDRMQVRVIATDRARGSIKCQPNRQGSAPPSWRMSRLSSGLRYLALISSLPRKNGNTA